MAIKRFEDIRAWQEARTLTKQIYTFGRTLPGLRRDRRLLNQMQAASVSIMANIAEGFSRRTSKEFIQFLFVAKGSAAEVQSLLYVAIDQNYLGGVDFASAYAKADEVAKITSGFITALMTRSKNARRAP